MISLTDGEIEDECETLKGLPEKGRRIHFIRLADRLGYGQHMYLFPELLTAHQNNDHSGREAYGFLLKGFTESGVDERMKFCQQMTEETK